MQHRGWIAVTVLAVFHYFFPVSYLMWPTLCVLWNKKTRKGLFPSALCQGTDHFNVKQCDKARKVTTQSLLDGEGQRGSYSCLQARLWRTGGSSSIHQLRCPVCYTQDLLLSKFIHIICQNPAPVHSWSIGQHCQLLGFSWGAGWWWGLRSVPQWYKGWNSQSGASGGMTDLSQLGSLPYLLSSLGPAACWGCSGTKMLLRALSSPHPCGRAGERGRLSCPRPIHPGERQHCKRGRDAGRGSPIIKKSPSANQKSLSFPLFLKITEMFLLGEVFSLKLFLIKDSLLTLISSFKWQKNTALCQPLKSGIVEVKRKNDNWMGNLRTLKSVQLYTYSYRYMYTAHQKYRYTVR